jgi:aminodeoxyfutalosine synthase
MISELAHRALERDGLGSIRDKVLSGERLTDEEGLRLLEANDLAAVGALANRVREKRHGDLTFYNRNVHLNPTNVCVATCKFCSFARPDDRHASEGYTMTLDEAVEKVLSKRPLGITEVHIVSGLHPDLPWEYYTELLARIRRGWPELAIKAFTAIELHFFAEKFGKSYAQVLGELRAAGMDTMPGGGAEIFAPRVRRKICDDKATADQWLEIHRTACGGRSATTRPPPTSGWRSTGPRTSSGSRPTRPCSTATSSGSRSASITCAGCVRCRTRPTGSRSSSRSPSTPSTT